MSRQLTYNKGNPLQGKDVKVVQDALCALEYLTVSDLTQYYDYKTEQAVIKFQKDNKIPSDGAVDSFTLKALTNAASLNTTKTVDAPKTVTDSTAATTTNPQLTDNTSVDNSVYTPFFNSKNVDPITRNGYDIDVIFGANRTVVETIKNVNIRSETKDVDMSGEAIYRTFEFVAQDVKKQ